MKRIFAVLLIAGLAGTANAHMLEEHNGLVAQLTHQLLGLHHLLPLLIIAVAFGLLARRKKS